MEGKIYLYCGSFMKDCASIDRASTHVSSTYSISGKKDPIRIGAMQQYDNEAKSRFHLHR